MHIRILGAGWYGCHIAAALIDDGHDVIVHEAGDRIFAGASGNIPARLHAGALHYPRSHATRQACLQHRDEFMQRYGFLTRCVPVNIYAIAAEESLIDFETYREVLRRDLEFITIQEPWEFGLRHVEGAVLTGERHIHCDAARRHFERQLEGRIAFGAPIGKVDDPAWDMTIDCTFCANDEAGVDRYEPCLTMLLEGRTDKAVTIMDGPFGSLYPWDEDNGLCSLTSAKWTPFSKTCASYEEARQLKDSLSAGRIVRQGDEMIADMAGFYPAVTDYRIADYRLSIRAMPKSGADTRLVDVARVGERALRVRAGKIDAVLQAERIVREMMQVPA